MADYINKCRTNYFHVKDPAAFREFMESAIDIEELWEEKDKDGNPVFGFSAYASPLLFCSYIKNYHFDVLTYCNRKYFPHPKEG